MNSPFDFLYYKKILRENGYELVQRGSTTYIRRRAWVKGSPTPRMLRAQGALTLASKTSTGARGLTEDGKPKVAEANRERIPEAMRFLRVTTPDRRAEFARAVAQEVGLEPTEVAELVELVRRK